MIDDDSAPSSALPALRRGLLILLTLGLAGVGTELLLFEHWEDVWQAVPLLLIGAGLAAVVWHAATGSRRSLRALQGVMALCVVAGAAGVILHYSGNVEFARELDPALAGTALLREGVTGGVPLLAPGVLCQLGLLGLAYAFRHPVSRRDGRGHP